MTSPEMSLFTGLLDDAAVFPPGNLPLAEAVPAHIRHVCSAHAGLVGALVLAAKDLDALAPLVAGRAPGSLALSLTAPLPAVGGAVAPAEAIPAVHLVSLEAALTAETKPEDVVPTLDEALAGRTSVTVFVEVPRDSRRDAVLAALSGTRFLAKFRTGGVRAELYPDEKELAGAVLAAVRAGVPFKATAGLHHALRNTDPETGFEQHGFLNLLAATAAALDGADETELVEILADRDGARVTQWVRVLSTRVREAFRSFGTCSITEPVEELADLGLLDPDLTKGLS
ncbi:hypothetical protein MXD63_32240 [Frankia sp. Cpl3]|nr:hypothetical protein [Frankia sp. Cpl3]